MGLHLVFFLWVKVSSAGLLVEEFLKEPLLLRIQRIQRCSEPHERSGVFNNVLLCAEFQNFISHGVIIQGCIIDHWNRRMVFSKVTKIIQSCFVWLIGKEVIQYNSEWFFI